MSPSTPPRPVVTAHPRWFYSVASLTLLVLMFIGFQWFYLQGKAYPGRPLTPPIRPFILLHGLLMTLWMLLGVVQPLLVATRHRRLHMRLGMLGVALAVAIVLSGVHLAIESARVSPPGMRLFGLAPREFMAVPLLSILLFGLIVTVGLLNRRRPEVHRAMMLLASLSVIGAALGRITSLNALYAGTWWELLFSAFLMQVLVAILLLLVKCVATRSFDRWLGGGVALLTLACVAISLLAKTPAWDRLAGFLLG